MDTFCKSDNITSLDPRHNHTEKKHTKIQPKESCTRTKHWQQAEMIPKENHVEQKHVPHSPLAFVTMETRSSSGCCCGCAARVRVGFPARAALASNTRARRSTTSAARAGSTAPSPAHPTAWCTMSRMYTHCNQERIRTLRCRLLPVGKEANMSRHLKHENRAQYA